MKSKKQIEEWILKDLSTPDPRFNMLPRCPYAKRALLDNKILFTEVTENIYSHVKNLIRTWDNTYDIAVIHLNWSLTINAVETLRTTFNNMYEDQDFIFIEDCIEDINLMLLQRKAGIEKARVQLKETGYYSGDPQ